MERDFSSLSNYIFYTKTVKYTRGFGKIFQNHRFAPPSQKPNGVFVHFAMVLLAISNGSPLFQSNFYKAVDKMTDVW